MWPGCSGYEWIQTYESTVDGVSMLECYAKGEIFSVSTGEAFEQKAVLLEMSDPRVGRTGRQK